MAIHGLLPRKTYFWLTKKTAQPERRRERWPRREITGAGLYAQKCRLLFYPDNSPHFAYPCRVTDVASGGYGLSLLGCEGLPADILVGAIAFLEQTDKSLMPVELRWLKGPKLGVKRLPRGVP